MSTLAERLRDVVRPGGSAARNPPYDPAGNPPCEPVRRPGAADVPSAADPARADAADTLGGQWCEAIGQRFLVVDRRYTPGHRHGRVSVADSLPPSSGAWDTLGLLAGGPNPTGRLLFVDLETTGLAGGAGTCAFLVGCGWFDGGTFRIRQFFLSSPPGERGLLHALAEMAADAGAVVTYNGKTFDLPLIETRFLFHRMSTPFAAMTHIDMLHAARRLWRSDDDDPDRAQGSCRLTAIEETQLGHLREGDVPGFEIPGRYFHYVRTGDARPLDGVLEHNRLDILALAMMTARAAQMLDEGVAAARTAREALGLGRLYERGGRTADARTCYARAAEMTPAEPLVRAEALRSYAVLSRRDRAYSDAAGAWERLLGLRRCPPRLAREAIEALAVHHEHRLRDLATARRFALEALQFNVSRARADAVRHRLARLDRKIGGPTPPPAPAALF
jgi:uncharacterized protein YprB with RNaseH-like and TPR domain